MMRVYDKLNEFYSNRWLVFVCAMWIQSCAGVGYLFGSISPVIKSAMGYTQREVAILGVAKDLGDAIGFVAGWLCEVLPIWALLAIGVVQNFLGYGLLWLIVIGVLPSLPLWVVSLSPFIFFSLLFLISVVLAHHFDFSLAVILIPCDLIPCNCWVFLLLNGHISQILLLNSLLT